MDAREKLFPQAVSTLDFDPSTVKTVLIYRLGSLGDTIVALPALHLIAKTFPVARRIMLTNIPIHAKAPAAAAILDGSGLVDGYISYPIGTRSAVKLAQLWWKIRRLRPEVLVYLAASRGPRSVQRDREFFRLCGVSKIVGLPVGNLAESLYDPASDLWEREAARLLRCMSPLGAADLNDPRNWDLRLTDAETGKAREILAVFGPRRLVACGPGTKMQSKDWGHEKWRELLARVSAQLPNHALALIGAKEDWDVSEYARAEWKGPALNLCGKLTPRESAAVIRHADLFLGPDSGPMHLAAAYGVPCAIPFSAMNRRGRWFPIGESSRAIYHPVACSGCGLTECVEKQKVCIESISVEEMFEAVLEAMQLKQPGV